MYSRHPGDDLLSNDKRLKYRWVWSRVASGISENEIKRWTHFQCSNAKVGRWEMEVIQWGSEPVYYEARISYANSRIASIGNERQTGFKTRIDAQLKAEQLLREWISQEYEKIIE